MDFISHPFAGPSTAADGRAVDAPGATSGSRAITKGQILRIGCSVDSRGLADQRGKPAAEAHRRHWRWSRASQSNPCTHARCAAPQ